MSQSPFKLKTIRSIFSFGSSQPSQEKGSQDRGKSQPIRCAGLEQAIHVDSAPPPPMKNQGRNKRSLNLALSQVTLGSPVEGLAASSSYHQGAPPQQSSGQRDADMMIFDSHPTATLGTQNAFSQSQDFFCTPDFITPNDANLKLPAPGINAAGNPFGVASHSNPPTRDFTPLGCKRPRSVFDVLMCPENRRSQLQAYTQELNAYKPPGTRVRGGASSMRSIKHQVPKSPVCVRNPFKSSLRDVPANVRQENLLASTDDETEAGDQTKGGGEGEHAAKRKRTRVDKRKSRRKKMFLSLAGMNSGRYRSDFKEVQRLGHGSFSTVYRCIHRLDGTQYAIKHVKKNLNTSNADIAQALQEVQAYSALGSHPFLLTYHTSWIENARLYIQLELSDCCLTDLTKQGKTFDEEELVWMVWSVLQSLSHMHASSLAHLDVKPDNIHVVGNKYKLGDLGTCTKYESRALKGPQASGGMMENKENRDGSQQGGDCCGGFLYKEGDARYMAPELLNDVDLARLDKSDVWALGAAAYELARKCPLPMKGENYRKIREDKLAEIPSFSAAFFDLIATMMRSDPAKRPSAQDIMKHAIFDQVRATSSM